MCEQLFNLKLARFLSLNMLIIIFFGPLSTLLSKAQNWTTANYDKIWQLADLSLMHFQQHVSSHYCTYISLLGIIFRKLARDVTWLKSNGITHVVNCAQGKRFGQVDTDASYYYQTGIQYFGIPGHDSVKFDITKHFEESSSFIDEGNKSGMSVKVLISIPRYLVWNALSTIRACLISVVYFKLRTRLLNEALIVWNALSTIRASLRSLVLSLKYTTDIKLFTAVCMIQRSSQL